MFFKKTNYKDQIEDIIKNRMLKMMDDDVNKSDRLMPVFSNAELMIRDLSEKELVRMMKQNNINNVELLALNILQNWAMSEIIVVDQRTFIMSNDSDDPAFEYFNEINNEKLEKGYITQKQYDDNKLMGVKIKTGSAFL